MQLLAIRAGRAPANERRAIKLPSKFTFKTFQFSPGWKAGFTSRLSALIHQFSIVIDFHPKPVTARSPLWILFKLSCFGARGLDFLGAGGQRRAGRNEERSGRGCASLFTRASARGARIIVLTRRLFQRDRSVQARRGRGIIYRRRLALENVGRVDSPVLVIY